MQAVSRRPAESWYQSGKPLPAFTVGETAVSPAWARPVSDTLWGLSAASSDTVRLALLDPSAVGANETAMSQLVPAARLMQPFEAILKSAAFAPPTFTPRT